MREGGSQGRGHGRQGAALRPGSAPESVTTSEGHLCGCTRLVSLGPSQQGQRHGACAGMGASPVSGCPQVLRLFSGDLPTQRLLESRLVTGLGSKDLGSLRCGQGLTRPENRGRLCAQETGFLAARSLLGLETLLPQPPAGAIALSTFSYPGFGLLPHLLQVGSACSSCPLHRGRWARNDERRDLPRPESSGCLGEVGSSAAALGVGHEDPRASGAAGAGAGRGSAAGHPPHARGPASSGGQCHPGCLPRAG